MRWVGLLLVGAVVAVGAVLGTAEVRDRLATRQLSGDEEGRLSRSNALIYDWCLARRRPEGGIARLAGAIRTVRELARDQPRRRTAVSDSAYVTPRQLVTNEARFINGTCRRPVPGAEVLRREAIALTAGRASPSDALSGSEVRARLARIAPTVVLMRSAGPSRTTTLRGYVRRAGDAPLRLAVVLGPDAALKARAYRPRLVAGVSNRTAIHPIDGIDTALILDTSGLIGAPYTMNTSIPRSERSARQRRGDLRNAAEDALVGQVSP